jgi:hypothetical protein
MKIKPLTFLLSLTFLFLFSGSIFATSLNDEKILGKFFNSYKSVTAIMPKTFLEYSKEEKISYVRGQLDGEATLMEIMKHPDSGLFIDCVNRKDTEIISGSLKLRSNLELNLPMAWSVQKVFGRFCRDINQQNKNSTYVNKTTELDLIELIYDARSDSKTGGSPNPIVKKCMESLDWKNLSREKIDQLALTASQKKKLAVDSEFCFEEDRKNFDKTSDQIHNAYFHGITDGFVFIFYNYNVPNTLGFLKCFSDQDNLKRAIRMFKNLGVTHPDKSPLKQAGVVHQMICSK